MNTLLYRPYAVHQICRRCDAPGNHRESIKETTCDVMGDSTAEEVERVLSLSRSFGVFFGGGGGEATKHLLNGMRLLIPASGKPTPVNLGYVHFHQGIIRICPR